MVSGSPESPVGSDQDPMALDQSKQPLIGANTITDSPQQVPEAGDRLSGWFGDRAYQALFEAATDAMVITDPQGGYVAVNRVACELFGLTQAELCGQHLANFAPPGFDLEGLWPGLSSSERCEFTVVRADSTSREVECTVTANFIPHYHLLVLRDVTERNQLHRQLQQLNQASAPPVTPPDRDSEQVVRESEIRFAAVFQASPDAILVTRLSDGLILEANPEFVQMSGYTLEEAIGHTTVELQFWVSPADRTLLATHLQVESTLQNQEMTFRRKSGELLVTLLSCQVVELAGQLCILSVVRDISDRKQVEAALQASEAQYRRIVETANEGIWIIDADHNTSFVNPKIAEMLGYSIEEMIGKSLFEFIDAADRDSVANWLKHRCQEVTEQHDFKFRHRNGAEVWTVVSTKPIFNDAGDYVGVLGMIIDISARKAAEISLQQMVQELTHHVENSPLATIRWDREFQVERWSRQAEQMFGWTAEEVVGKTMYEWKFLYEEDLEQINQAATQLLTGHSAVCHNRNYHKDGSVLHCEWYNSTLLDEQGNLVSILSLAQDVSDRKRNEAEREMAERALRQREQEFRTLVENSPDAIMRCDRQYRFLYVNPTVTQLTEMSNDMLIGQTTEELGYPEHLTAFWNQALERVFTQGQEQFLEYEMGLPKGNLAFYSRVVPELAEDGSVISVLVVARDITDLKQAQNALVQRSEREHSLRLLTQHIRASLDLNDILATAVTEVQRILQVDRTLIFRLNSDHSGVVIQESVCPEYPVTLEMRWEDECFPPDCYAAYCQGTARIVPDVALDTWGECLVEFMQQTAVKSKIVAPIVQHEENGAVRVWGLLIVHACDEPRVWHEDEANLLEQVANQLAIALQQSELHQKLHQWADTLEEQVQERTAEIQQALDLDATLKRITDRVRDSLDEDQILETVVEELGRVLSLEYCDTSIYNAEQTASTIAYEFSNTLASAQGYSFPHQDAPHAEVYPQLLQGQICQFSELAPNFIRSSDQLLTILACPIVDEQRVLGDLWLFKPLQGLFNDLEVRLVQQVANQCAIALRQSRLYQTAQAQVQELERLNQLKDDFLSTVSHELRTPMSNIKMATQMLEISLNRLGILADDSLPIRRYFTVLQEEGRREINLINDLLDLARLDAGTEPLNYTRIDLPVYLSHIAKTFVERTRQQQQQFVIQIPERLSPLTTDVSCLERILTELLHNACKYTPAQKTITVSAQVKAAAIEICISNSGVEIPVSECEHIFDKFYRIPNNDPWQHGGTGLGLALVKKLTERLGGKIWVESSHGQTTFILQFSLMPCSPEPLT